MDELMQVLKSGDVNLFKSSIDAKPSLVNAKNQQGVSILMMCAYYGRQEFIDILIQKGVQIGFFEAVILGKEDYVNRFLVERPELVNTFAPDGFTPLCLAVYFGHKNLAQILLAKGADVNGASRNAMKVRPLHSAVANGNEDRVLDLVKLLVTSGADVNLTQESGWVPLHESVSRGLSSVAEYLLRHKADPNAAGTDGRRPIDFVAKDNSKMRELLKLHGATGKDEQVLGMRQQ